MMRNQFTLEEMAFLLVETAKKKGLTVRVKEMDEGVEDRDGEPTPFNRFIIEVERDAQSV